MDEMAEIWKHLAQDRQERPTMPVATEQQPSLPPEPPRVVSGDQDRFQEPFRAHTPDRPQMPVAPKIDAVLPPDRPQMPTLDRPEPPMLPDHRTPGSTVIDGPNRPQMPVFHEPSTPAMPSMPTPTASNSVMDEVHRLPDMGISGYQPQPQKFESTMAPPQRDTEMVALLREIRDGMKENAVQRETGSSGVPRQDSDALQAHRMYRLTR